MDALPTIRTWLLRGAIACATGWMVCLHAGCGSRLSAVEPSIQFETVPRAANGGTAALEPIAGRVKGARPNQRIVLFAKARTWWVQPFKSRPFTTIEPDSTWKSTIHLGTDYAALLVEPEYRPPVTAESLPPLGGGVVAIATVSGTGTFVPPPRKTLTFSGYEWEIRVQPNERRGQNEYDARNASVDQEGHLHLLVTQRDGRWTSAEVQLTRSLGYGAYMFDLRDTSALGASAAFEIYMWDEAAIEQHHRELNINIGHVGDGRTSNAQYVLQPDDIATNVFRFLAPSGRLTHGFRWQSGQLAFNSRRAKTLVAERQFTAGVPAPGAERAHMLLQYIRDSPGPPGKDIEVVVERFAYLP